MTDKNKINIQLGDIIQLNAPSNSIYHDKIIIIDFINNEKIKGKTSDNEIVTLKLDENQNLTDESIKNIFLLNREDTKGYAKLHNLLPETWIDIYFGGDIPETFTGKITDLEEDLIEIKLYPSEDVIYIDFKYQGIPENLNIEKIKIRGIPEGYDKKEDDIEETEIDVKDSIDDSESKEEIKIDIEDEIIEQQKEKKKMQKDLFIKANEIQFGSEVGEITQIIEVPEDQKRYSLQKQSDDLLNDLLSTIPNSERIPSKLKEIHTTIQRFIQLRAEFSEFDNNNNPFMIKKKGSNYKPLVNSLLNNNQKFYWILPIVENNKKVYDIDLESQKEYLNITNLSLTKTIVDEHDLYEKYLKNNYNYSAYLKLLNPYLTPFIDLDNNNTFNSEVNTNILGVDNNLENLNSYAVSKNTIYRKKFLFSSYNTALTKLQIKEKINQGYISSRSNITKNDIINISSFLTLPESTIRFTKILLPLTNVLERSGLNLNFLEYYRFLNEKTKLYSKSITDFSKEIDYQDNFAKNIRYFDISPSAIYPEFSKEKFKDFLNTIIPKTRVLFNLTKKYIKGKLSLYDVSTYLEPFLVYTDDISFKLYEEIGQFIEDEINEFKQNYVKNKEYFKTLIKKTYFDKKPKESLLYEILSSFKEEIFEEYKLIDKVNNYNIINTMFKYDNMVTYMNCLSLINSDLFLPFNFSDLLEEQNEKIKLRLEKTKTDDSCKQYVLAKRYIDDQDLKDDENIEIYFDKKYDTTYYDILQEYKSQKESMSDIDFKEFLIEKLIENMGFTKEEAVYEASSMINQKRKVIDGQYAVLEKENNNLETEFHYFKRHDGKWLRDDELKDNVIDQKTFCNIKPKCLQVKNECETEEKAEISLKKDLINEIANEFDEKLSLNKNQYELEIKENFENSKIFLKKLIVIRDNQLFKYNDIYYYYALDVINEEKEKSPYYDAFQKILGLPNFVQKQQFLNEFIKKYTRPAIEENKEDPYWFYCRQTNTKLVPSFLFRLSNVFVNNGDYLLELDKICREQGTISDDNEAWIDKHSGYIIKQRDLDTEEGYDEGGFKMQSREILEKDLGEQILEKAEDDKPIYQGNALIVNNLINTITKYIGINLESQKGFIIDSTLTGLSEIIPSEERYIDNAKEYEKKKGKKLPSYKHHFNENLLLLTLGSIVIAIQTAIPSLRSKKSFPGCKKSFTGYPLDGVEDLTGINYIACVAHKIRTSIEPWNTILKLKEISIANKIRSLIDLVYLPSSRIQKLLDEKRNFLIQTEDDFIPVELSIQTWKQFLPPLIPINLKSQLKLSSEFEKSLFSEIKKGTNKGQQKIDVVKSKVIFFSYEIIQKIEDIVQSQKPLLNSLDPYTQNSCCAKNTREKFLTYFTDKDSDIITDNDYVKKLSIILQDIRLIQESSILYDPFDTKLKYPILSQVFDEDTKYLAVMNFCNYNNDIPLSDELTKVCLMKPEDYDKNDSLSEKIRKMERDNIKITDELFYSVLNIVNKEHILKIHNYNSLSSVEKMRVILNNLEEKNSPFLSQTLIDLLKDLLDDFDINETDSERGRRLRNYLSSITEKMIKNITFFLRNNSDFSTQKMNNIKDLLENIMDFYEDGSNPILTPKDESLYRNIEFVKNSLYNLVDIFLNMIINKKQRNVDTIEIPKHWNLSDRHKMDIKNFVSQYYDNLQSFYGIESLREIFLQITNSIPGYLRLIDITHFYASIESKGDESIESILNYNTCKQLFHYYFLSVIYSLLQKSSKFHKKTNLIEDQAELNIDEILSDTAQINEDEVLTEDTIEIQIIQGEIKTTKEKMADFVGKFLLKVKESKKILNVSKQLIKENTQRSKDKEKDEKVRFLGELSIEEREVENLFKKHRLEKWSVGLQRGLVSYEKETYDEELKALEKTMNLEKQLGKKDYVSDMNRDIYIEELEQDEYNTTQIENEELDMNVILDDDDDLGRNDYDYGPYILDDE